MNAPSVHRGGRAAAAVGVDLWGAAFIVVVGTLWHFVYDWAGRSTAVGWVAPVNESVWEHSKLVVFPALVWNLVAAFGFAERGRLAWAALLEACAGAAVIVGGYYAYAFLLGGGFFVADILLFLVAVACGRIVNRSVRCGSGRVPGTGISLALILALVAVYAALTSSPPDLPPFVEQLRDGV